MNIGIIGYGSMGRMLAEKFARARCNDRLYISNRTAEKLIDLPKGVHKCRNNIELAEMSDIVIVCTRPNDIKAVLEEIGESLSPDTMLVSLNGSITFEMMEKTVYHKTAKVIPSVTAEIDRSQTLMCFNELVTSSDKEALKELFECIGNVIELPESELGMGAELVSCMPGFIAALFDVICSSAKKNTSLPDEQIVDMVLNTLCATGTLMLEKEMTFNDIVARVATGGGITEEGTRVIYEDFPSVADGIFEKTLKKRRLTAQKAKASFASDENA